MTEQELRERLRKVERLFSGATTAGERDAAGDALSRIQAKLKQFEEQDPPVEYRFSLPDPWTRKLFVALLRRYGVQPYRLPRQKRQSVMARVPRSFVSETLWPEFLDLSAVLREYLSEITESVIRREIHEDTSEAREQNEPHRLAE